MPSIAEAKQLVCELCSLYYDKGWMVGTGGGISIKAGDKYVVAPSGVQKERMKPDDLFVLSKDGSVFEEPKQNTDSGKPPKLSESVSLFLAMYEHRDAGAIFHSHSVNSVLATLLEEPSPEFCVTQLEMVKGVAGHGFYDKCVVPIIENKAREHMLLDTMTAAMKAYPKSNAVLVRRHGVYVWGKSWVDAKTQIECYEYLFEAAVRMRSMGVTASHGPLTNGTNGNEKQAIAGNRGATKRRRVSRSCPSIVVFDIEGTVSPLTFVTDVMFPFALNNVKQHLESLYSSQETQEDIDRIRDQAAQDLEDNVCNVVVPGSESGKDAVVSGCCAWVADASKANRKIGALKVLQGHIWRQGFANGDLVAPVFEDVPIVLSQWDSWGLKMYVYSSGSREAQRMFFKNTKAGDLLHYFNALFDTTVGKKFESDSYKEIALTLGVESPESIVFCTDVLAEAEAAHKAGWTPVVVVRPGNKPITEKHDFKVVESLAELSEAWQEE